jgi:glycosyltransferase involved in cell wall biosynthesis
MKILFLLSCLEPAGSETYCVSLAEAWDGKHEVSWISDRLHHGQTYKAMPIHRKAFPGGLLNTFRVATFVRRHKIDLIHSHSRRAHWVAAQAAALAGVPHVTTVHQPPPVHFFSRFFPCLGDATIAIDEMVADYLHQRFGCPGRRIHLIRNGINLTALIPSARQAPNMRQILYVGRLSGGRWLALQFFLEVLQHAVTTLPPAHYKIVGKIPDERRRALADQLSIIGSRIAPSTIETLGYVGNLGSLVRNSDGVIASGRSALESLASGRTVLLMGEGGVLGLCSPKTWPLALRTNMGDHLEPKAFDPDTLEAALRELLLPRAEQAEIDRWARLQVEKYFDIRTVAKQVEDVYVDLIPRNRRRG